MKLLILSILITISTAAMAQHGEGVEPMAGNPSLIKNAKNIQSKANTGTFDSTFIYLPDTLQLPLFDDFSTNKYQTYSANFTDPGVTSDKKYRLLDLTDNPLPNTALYTAQQTFTRTFDIGNGTSTDDNFPSWVEVIDQYQKTCIIAIGFYFDGI